MFYLKNNCLGNGILSGIKDECSNEKTEKFKKELNDLANDLITNYSIITATLEKIIFEEDFLPCAAFHEVKQEKIRTILEYLYGQDEDIKKALLEICKGREVY
jgi:hypothetical protein